MKSIRPICFASSLVIGTVVACTRSQPDTTNDTRSASEAISDDDTREQDAHGAKSPGTLEKPVLLLAQAQFQWTEVNGKRTPKPGAAKLRLLHLEAGQFEEHVIEDEDSRVFHKAICFGAGEDQGLLTAAATDAHLKHWTPSAEGWRSQTLWTGDFGGSFDRLRDLEIGDVDHDGDDEIVIATHDQGVIAVLDQTGERWSAQTVFEKADTFVHEVELGDLDGDKRLEIYATPSKPNRANRSQSGSLIKIEYRGKRGYSTEILADFKDRHAKEILADDLDGDGIDELYAAVEASVQPNNGKLTVASPVEIREFSFKKKGWLSKELVSFPEGLQSRVILLADLTGSGARELVVTTMKSGVWRVSRGRDGEFEKAQIDNDSGGFEHAAHAVDLDGDGLEELYVTSDDHDEVRRYIWNGKSFDRSVIGNLEKSDLVWNITSCR